MSYAQISDMQARYPARDLIQITDPVGRAIQTAPIQIALNDASVEIDGYLEARFSLPLADPPARLVEVCCTIAMYKLQALRPLHDMKDARDRYNDAIALLQRVAQGKTTLGLSADSVEPPIAGSVETVQGPDKMFTRRRLRGY